jgi:hypothetical protein
MNSLLQNLTFEVSARTRNLIEPKLKQKLVYIHIPKCGGVAISKALKACYINWNIRDSNLYKLSPKACHESAEKLRKKSLNVYDPAVIKFCEKLLLYGMFQPRIEYISGHFSFSIVAYQAFHHEYSFVTMLRDPVKRWISEYFYNRYKSHSHAKIDLDINAYLNSEVGRANGQTYARYLCGLTEVKDYNSEDIIAQSKENLHKFGVVGCIEHLDVFKQQFYEQFGRQLNIGRWNKNPKSRTYQESVITDAIMNQIEEICRPDIELYNYAVKEFIGNSPG